MDNSEFLKYFIQEDIYQIEEEIPEVIDRSPEKPDASSPSEDYETSSKDDGMSDGPVQEVDEAATAYTPKNEILILVQDAHNDILEPNQLAYLEKILGAVKLSRDNVDMINVEKLDAVPYSAYKKIISFVPQLDVPFGGVEKYSFVRWEGCMVAIADPVSTISASVELRKQLWNCLKSGFGI